MTHSETDKLIREICLLFPNFNLSEEGVDAWESAFAEYNFEFRHARQALQRIIGSGVDFAPNISQIISRADAIYRHEQEELKYKNLGKSESKMSDEEWKKMQKRMDDLPAAKVLRAKYGISEH
jgi:hypothetical protein